MTGKTEATESIKDKIRKLLAKADNTACTVEEAAAFNAKAYELMAKYNLDRAMIIVEEKTSRTHRELMVDVRPWSNAILHGICKLYMCKWFYRRQGRHDTVILVGEETNVTVAHAIAVMTLRAVIQESRRTGGGRSFMTGAGYTIQERVKEMMLESKKTKDMVDAREQVNALVLVEDQGNADYITELNGGVKLKEKKGKKPVIRNAAARVAGQEFGKTLPLRQGQLS